jgi:carboxyl-terminal processing protease
MLPANNRGPGANLCAPDVCFTPPPPVKNKGRPVPYVDRANHSQAVPFSPTVRICGLNALYVTSQVPVTTGDDAGVNGPGPKRVGKFTSGNPIVKVDGIPGTNLTSPATGNAGNASGAALVPDQIIVRYTRAGAIAQSGEGASMEQVLALQASIDTAAPPAGTMLAGRIGYLRIAAFSDPLSARIHHELNRLEAQGMRALILDLRGNPGGELGAAVRLAGDFLPRGAALATIVDADGDETVHRNHTARSLEVPLALLVDRGTASAAELFAGCLQAHGRAVVVGERTYGKGTVQALLPGSAAPGAYYATVASFTLPGGGQVDRRGLLPDVAVDASDDDTCFAAAIAALTHNDP